MSVLRRLKWKMLVSVDCFDDKIKVCKYGLAIVYTFAFCGGQFQRITLVLIEHQDAKIGSDIHGNDSFILPYP